MTVTATLTQQPQKNRLVSLDFMRGLIMVILILGETGFFYNLDIACKNPVIHSITQQFEHSRWHGLRLWDVLLPAFMLIAGTSMAYSYHYQKVKLQYTWFQSLKKTTKRSSWLLFWGVFIYIVKDNRLNIEFTNVLAQLAFTTFISFFFINWPAKWQIAASLFFLIFADALFRFTHIPGFDQPFVRNHNFGSYVDMLLLNNVTDHHYTNTLNFISSTAHTLWGITLGQLLMSNKSSKVKFSITMVFGFVILLAGLSLDITNINPILKWISSSSFVLVTGGITLILMAICYQWVDVLDHKKYLSFFTIVGVNSIFIYLFFIFIGTHWLYGFADVLIKNILNLAGVPIAVGSVCACFFVFVFEWCLCYFLFKKKLFFKL